MNKICLALLLTGLSIHLLAQDNITVSEIQKNISAGGQPGFSVTIPQAKRSDVASDWKRYVRKSNKSKYKSNGSEYELAKTIITEVSNDSLTLYSIIEDGTAGVTMQAFIEKNTGFVSGTSDPGTASGFSAYMRNFAVDQYRKAVQNEVDAEKDKLKALENELSKLEKNIRTSEKNIRANERSIKRLEEEVKANIALQEMKTAAIYQQQQVVATFLEPSDLKKAEEDKLKDLEKEKKKLQKQNESLHQKIDKLEDKIRQSEKQIDRTSADKIPMKNGEIATQKEVIAAAELKLSQIR